MAQPSNQPQPLPVNIETGPLAYYGGFVYTIGSNDKLYKLSTSVAIPDNTAVPILDVSIAVGYQYITIYNNPNTSKIEMYISAVGNNQYNNGSIYIISDLDNPTTPTEFISDISSPRGLQGDNGYLYVVTYTSADNTTSIIRFLLTDVNIYNAIDFDKGVFTGPQQLVIVGDNLYVMNYPTNPENYIAKVNTSLTTYQIDWVDANSIVNGGALYKILVTDGTFLYFNYYTDDQTLYNYMGQINISTGDVVNSNYFPNFVIPNTFFFSAVINNNIFYIGFYPSQGSYDYTIYNLPIYNSNISCFKEDTKILTNEGYKFIQDLRKGDLVKTLKNDYKPIEMIGKREIYHNASKERIKDQLYKYSQNEYPEIFEDLIITGCHAILVDKFKSDQQKEKVIEIYGEIYVTDSKYRLPVCADLHSSIYEIPGTYTVYHLALENDNCYMNYGIYANGLLVESCSKNYLKNKSKMTLI